MAITPNSEIYLLETPLGVAQEHTIKFANATAQANYFLGLPKLVCDDFSYIRKDSVIRYPAHIDSIRHYNYVMYKNDNYGDKWFYAYITSMDYQNDNMTYIKIKTDTLQTWLFDMVWHKSFVDREHVSNDTFGLHTLNEGMDGGEYVVNGFSSYKPFNETTDCYIGVQVTYLPDVLDSVYGNSRKMYGGTPQGCWLILLENETNNISNFTRTYDFLGKTDAINAMFIVPKRYAPNAYSASWVIDNDHSFDATVMPESSTSYNLGTYTWDRLATVDGYRPKNSKVLCYPYNYLLITNNGGQDIKFNWEDFSSSSASFKVTGTPNQGCQMKLIPTNYKKTNTDGGFEWSVDGQMLPTISWSSDYYLNWQAYNGVNAVIGSVEQSMGVAKDVGRNIEASANGRGNMYSPDFGVKEFAGVIGGYAQTIMGTYGAITNALSSSTENYKSSITPAQAKGNANTGDLNFAMGKSGFTGYKMSVKAEYAKLVDDYFTAYGYKVSEYKIPELTSRRNWNYVKTAGANITGRIPDEDIQEIKGIFDRGVTLWHNPANFLNYDVDNSIV